MSEAGEIIGRIKLDGLGEYLSDIDTAQAATEGLGATDPKIKVTTEGTGKAVAELEAVKAAEDRVEGSTRKVSAAQKDGVRAATDWRSAMIGGLVAVSAAAPPVAAAAVGITAAFGVMGGAGVLGLAGIVRGMKENNAVGQEYRSTVDSLTASLHSAEDAGAQGLFPGIQKSAALLNQQMPTLNAEVQHFAGMLGAMLPTGLDATVTLIERANPLLDAAGGYLGRIVSGIDNWAHGNGYRDFLDYSIRELPQVEKFLGDTGHLVGDFLKAWAPLGADTLPMLDDLVVSVDDLVKRTGPLVPAAIAVAGAWKLLSPVAGMLSTIVGWTSKLGSTAVVSAAEVNTLAAAEERAATAGAGAGGGAGLLGKAKGLAGAAALGAGMAVGDSYETSNINPQLLGQSSYTQGVAGRSGGAPGMDAALSQMVKSGDAAKAAAQFGQVQKAAAALGIKTQELAADFPKYTAAVSSAGKASSAAVAPVKAQTSAYQALVAQVNAAYAAQQKLATSNQNLEGTADSAKDAIAGLTASFKTNGASLDQDTAKGRANREAVLSAVQAIQAHGAALNADGQHALQARVSNDQMAISLEKTMEKFGVSKSAAQAYVNKLLGIPKNVSTEADLKNALALEHAAAAKKAAQAFADGDYTAALKADPSNMKSKVADAQKRAEAMAQANYTAFLKANPANATANTADAARKAHAFATGAYTAAIRANAAPAEATTRGATSMLDAFARKRPNPPLNANPAGAISGARRAQGAVDSVHGKTVDIFAQVKYYDPGHSFYGGGNIYTGAHGGTTGAPSFGKPSPGMAYGGTTGFTVRGPGSAASDQAGTYRLANGEEVISNLSGQADQWRPALKAMNAHMSPAAVLQKVAKIAGQAGQQGPTTVITRNIAPEVHIHNPVAVDPVQQVIDANQYVLAYSGLG